MRYIALIYGNEAAYAHMTEAERGADWQGYMTFNAEAGARGVLLGGEILQPSHTATAVRVRDTKLLNRRSVCRNERAARGLLHSEL